MESTLETTALEKFYKWHADTKKKFPELAKVPEYLLLCCFYAGASFGSDEASKIYKGLIT
jgi:hypothetical protein